MSAGPVIQDKRGARGPHEVGVDFHRQLLWSLAGCSFVLEERTSIAENDPKASTGPHATYGAGPIAMTDFARIFPTAL
jgi:hypothetical protein